MPKSQDPIQEVLKELKTMKVSLERLEKGQTGLRQDVSELKQGQSSLKQGQMSLERGMLILGKNQAALLEGQESISEDIGLLRAAMNHGFRRLSSLTIRVEDMEQER